MRAKKIRTLFIMVMVAMAIAFMPAQTQAASKPTLSAAKVTLKVGKTKKLKVKNVGKKKVTWTSSNKKVATVSKTGKVKAKKAGKATITAKVGKKKLKCKVTVKKAKKSGGYYKETLDGYMIPRKSLQDYKKIVTSVLGNNYTKKTEAERSWALAKWICDHKKYDLKHFNCLSYANLYFCLMNTAGVRCVVVASNSADHAWNEVFVDGKWYFCDVSAMDTKKEIYDANIDKIFVYCNYDFDYFMKSNKYIKKQDDGLVGYTNKDVGLLSGYKGWYDFILNSLPRCKSTKYDEADRKDSDDNLIGSGKCPVKYYNIWTTGDYKKL